MAVAGHPSSRHVARLYWQKLSRYANEPLSRRKRISEEEIKWVLSMFRWLGADDNLESRLMYWVNAYLVNFY